MVLVKLTLPEDNDLYKYVAIDGLPHGWDATSSSAAAVVLGDKFLSDGHTTRADYFFRCDA
jgi:hypothetical protein